MPDEVRCQYARVGNREKPHVVTYILPPHKLAGKTAILGCHGQEELKWLLKPGDIIVAEDRFDLADNGKDYLGDALPSFMQPCSPDYVEQAQEKEQLSTNKKELHIDKIVLVDHEMVEAFEGYWAQFGTKKEAGKRLLEYAMRVDALKLA